MNVARSYSLLFSHVLAVVFGCTVTAASANSGTGIERAQKTGTLAAGMSDVMPAYQAGQKFRTPETVESALAEDVATHLQASLTAVRTEQGRQTQLLDGGKADFVLATIDDNDPLLRSATVVPTGYSAGAMAIMRTDTDIKSWQQLKGRIVCVSQGGGYVGKIAARHGAIEKVFKAPADALLALRIGDCDAAVHDSTMLEALIKLPEWKKFSASLPVGPLSSLVFIAPAGDATTAGFLRQIAAKWRKDNHIAQLTNKRVRSIAFEVYLDQDVPDCH